MADSPKPEPDAADRKEIRYRVLSVKTIWWASGLIVAVGLGAAVWLLLAFGHGDEQDRNQLEAIKTAGTIVLGTGGAAALLLAARRQRTAEIALKQKDRDQAHQERVAAATEADSAARRITDLYTKAADQLGSDKAPVRLAGLYALERVAQTNPDQRQTIVDVLCAYLRMPYQIPGDPPALDADEPTVTRYREQMQEREVRLTAQRLISAHLQPGLNPDADTVFWRDIDLDLTGAILINFALRRGALRAATFESAQFEGNAALSGTRFSHVAEFDSARFNGAAHFDDVRFGHLARFRETQFNGRVVFDGASFEGTARFVGARFSDRAQFGAARFGHIALFDDARFEGDALFQACRFNRDVGLVNTMFEHGTPDQLARFLPQASKSGGGGI